MILILSADAVGAALLGALIETLGYTVSFARPAERPEDALRRARPRVCLFDCTDPDSCNEETVGRATMRGISTVAYGTATVLEQFRAAAPWHHMQTLVVPPGVVELDDALTRAVRQTG